MKLDDIFTQFEESSASLDVLVKEYLSVMKEYIDSLEQYEKMKIEKIDTTKRDSIEKQLINAMKEDEEFKQLHLKVERLKRERDKISKLLDFVREKNITLRAMKDIINDKR